MSLTFDETEKYLLDIFTGKKYELIDDQIILFKFPDNDIKQRADLIYEKSFGKAVSDGMLPLKDLEEILSKRNVITAEEIKNLSKLKSQLEAQEILLGKTTRVKANQERIKKVINRLRTEIHSIEFKRSSKLLMSAETKAEEDKSFYMCSRCVYNDDGSLFWNDYSDALKERRLKLRDKILLKFVRFCTGLPVNIIREIARSNIWRIRYINSMKTSDPLFGVPASDYTSDQLNLIYWSNFYQNIYEMLPEDRPSDLVIDDDEALDAFMKDFYKERTNQEVSKRHNSKRRGRLDAFDSEELIVTRSNELYQDYEYDTPREAQRIKNRVDLKKRTKRSK